MATVNVENIVEEVRKFVKGLFPQENIEMAEDTSIEEEAPVEEAAAPEFIVGEPLPDGEYEIAGQIIVLKDGKIESITPKEAPEEVPEEEEMAKFSSEVSNLKKEFQDKLEAQKIAFEAQLAKISESVKASGLIQAPIQEEETFKPLSAKERAINHR